MIASTQNQAFNALLFLYREVLHQELANIQAVRADRPARLPVVLTVDEVKQVIRPAGLELITWVDFLALSTLSQQIIASGILLFGQRYPAQIS